MGIIEWNAIVSTGFHYRLRHFICRGEYMQHFCRIYELNDARAIFGASPIFFSFFSVRFRNFTSEKKSEKLFLNFNMG